MLEKGKDSIFDVVNFIHFYHLTAEGQYVW